MSATPAAGLVRESFTAALLQKRPDAAALAALEPLRARAYAEAQTLPLPSTRDEAWRFTDLSPLTRHAFAPARAATAIDQAEIVPLLLPEAGARLVFVNGVYVAALSAPEVAGIRVLPLNDALRDAALGRRAAAEIGRHVTFEGRLFAAINTASFHDGAVIVVPAGQQTPAPIQLLFVSHAAGGAPAAYPRCLMLLEADAEAALVEEYATVGAGNGLTDAVTEIALGAGAVLRHVKLQHEAPDAFHLAHTAVTLDRDARYTSTQLSYGARLSRHELTVALAEGARCDVAGLTVIGGRQLADTHSAIDHRAPNATSRQLHKCIVGAAAHAVFNGKILVRRHAQRTDSAQSSRNLLLSDKARVDTKPELQIDADDVKCAHGATVGQLNPDELFYLQSRGIREELARGLLTFAFANEVIDRVTFPGLRARLQRLASLPGSGA